MEPLERLARLRRAMEALEVDAVIVPTADPHLSEYVPEHWALRRALSGFTGSAGTLAVARESAALVADSRYWEQAADQLPGEIELVRMTTGLRDCLAEWVRRALPQGACVGFDPEMLSAAEADALSEMLGDAGFAVRRLEEADALPIAEIWPDRPPMPSGTIRLMKRPGRPAAEKLAAVRKGAAEAGASFVLLTALDDVAWLTNLRGADVPCNPVFLANMLVGPESATLFVDAARLLPEAAKALVDAGIAVVAPAELEGEIARAAEIGRILADPEHTNSRLEGLIPVWARVQAPSPVLMLKCVKSPEEIAAIDEAHLRDAVALTEFYAELDERLAAGEVLTESDAARMLHGWRARDPEFFDESFGTIAAYGPHAALPHYAPPETGGAVLEPGGLLLIDSGGQYECGTTDVTRMTPVGDPTPEMRRDVAVVTRAMLRLLNLRFPEGATGPQIDAAARMDLWARGMDYGHGTGHGVGYVLNVHEGPVTISPRAKPIPIRPGNVLSDEPGVYRPGRWGVRVENLVVCEEDCETEFGRFLKFRALTKMPIDVRMFAEPFGEGVEALNAFNAERVALLTPLVSERARAWLERAAHPLEA